MTSLRTSLLLTAALVGLILTGAGAAAACTTDNLVGALGSDFGNACVNGH
ncbi:hypothetical protein ACFW1A_05550 [Kitasatospora sp. NPDC058965]